MPVRMTKEGRASTREEYRYEQKQKAKKEKFLTGGQAKIAAKAPPPNKIDEKDFAVLRAEKAKGRGMGLQDEKVKPGKVMKANLGLMFMKKAKDKGAKGAEFLSPLALAKRMFNKKAGGVIKARVGKSITKKIPLAGKSTSVGSTTMKGMKFSDKAKMVDSGKINKSTGKFTSMEAVREAKGYRPGETSEKFNKRMSAASKAAKVAKSTRVGKILLPIVGAGVAAQQYLKSKMNKKKDVKKKMGGGMMMQKPMGYSEGMGPKLGEPRTQQRRAGPAAGRPGTGRGRKAGLGALGGAGRSKGKEDSSVTLGKFMKAKVDSINKTVKAGGIGADRVLSKYRRPEKVRENIKSGKFKQTKDAAYYKSIGLTGKRGDAAVKDFFKPESVRLKNLSKNMQVSSRMGGGMMQRPMGYKSGTSVKVKCKLGRNKPTKIT